MGLTADCQTYFQTEDLYGVLNVDRNAEDRQIKKAYRLLSLKVHPDHAEEGKKEESTRKFQTLAKVYMILSDEDKRKIYDETGSIDEDECGFEDRDWYAYWRSLFPRITEEDIKSCLLEYKGSEEEMSDLKKFYLEYEGDLDKISQCLIGYELSERDRYIEIIREMIKKDEIPEFKKFAQACKKIQKNKKEVIPDVKPLSQQLNKNRRSKTKMEPKKVKKTRELSPDDDSRSLEELINGNRSARERRFDDMLTNLEKKYGKPPPTTKRRKQ